MEASGSHKTWIQLPQVNQLQIRTAEVSLPVSEDGIAPGHGTPPVPQLLDLWD